jgi:Rieske Fe-S protein
MDRRHFVQMAAAGIVGACASMVVTPVTPDGSLVHLPLRDYPRLRQPGGALKIRPAGSNRMYYVLALENGDFAAVSPICKHQGCTVDIARDRLECPCHGSMYTRDGKVLRGPTQAPLDRYPVHLSDDGVLTIDLGSAE